MQIPKSMGLTDPLQFFLQVAMAGGINDSRARLLNAAACFLFHLQSFQEAGREEIMALMK
jgi:hypothetical protein